ncbi:MAG TPA: NfeD family protein [Isosphaeraceae bacterium]|jgi:membrane-bound ClpP family serine protease
MSNELIWPILWLVLGLLLLIAEVFIPSGGLIGILALGLICVSLGLAFAESTALGLKFLVAVCVLMPLALALAIHLWPRTPLAKRFFLQPPGPEEVQPAHVGPGVRLEHLIGQFGRALTPLRPSGMVDFDGRRIDGLSEEGLIPAGSLVRAVQVRGSQLVVRVAADRTLDELLI